MEEIKIDKLYDARIKQITIVTLDDTCMLVITFYNADDAVGYSKDYCSELQNYKYFWNNSVLQIVVR